MLHFPIIIGHRGAAGLAPENTLAAIQAGMELGVDRVEIDVHLSKDGIPVVMHDSNVKRTTNGRGFINQKTLEDLKKLSAGIKFSPEFANEKIPTLEEVFELVNGKVDLHLEVKYGSSRYPGIEQLIFNLIEKHNAAEWCFINSFDNRVLRNFKKISPLFVSHKLLDLRIPVLPAHIDKNLNIGYLKRYKAVTEFGFNYKFITHNVVKQIHLMHKRINAWTPNERADFKKLIEMGVDGIITNRPDILVEMKKEMGL